MNIFLWIFIVAVISFFWLTLNKKLFNDFLSPFNLLLPTWVIPVLLTLLNLSTKEPVWHIDSILMVFYTTVMLAFVSLIPFKFLKKNSKAKDELSFTKMCHLVNSTKFTLLMNALYLFGCISVIYNELITNPLGGAPMIVFLLIPDISRDPGWLWKGDYWFFSIPVFTLLPFYYIKVKMAANRFKKFFYIGLLIFYPIVGVLKLSRSEIVFSVIGIVLMHHYWKKSKNDGIKKGRLKKNLKVAAIVLIIGIISSTFFQQLRGNTESFSDLNDKVDMGFNITIPEPFASLTQEVYTYFAIPFHNLVHFVNNYDGGTHPGVGILRPLYSATAQGSGIQDDLDKVNFDSYLQMFPANTYPFLNLIYVEAGWLGIFLAPIIIAGMVNALYVFFRTKRTFIATSLYFTMISYQWIWLFCNGNFTGIQYYIFGLFSIVVMLMYKFLFRFSSKTTKVQLITVNN
jgi:oligosaccharide repeat unit polymerase